MGDLTEQNDRCLPEANPSSHAARVLLADIFYKSGCHGEAEGVLRTSIPAD